MTDSIIITAGRPNRQPGDRDFAGPDGTYPVTLVAISDPITEKSTQPPKGPNDDGMYTYRIWTLAIDDGSEHDGQVIDMRANVGSTGPKSKQYALVAGFSGAVPPIGAVIELPKLIGRRALALIQTNENDYPYVHTVLPLPAERNAPAQAPAQAPEPAPEPAPAPTATPLRETVAAGASTSNDLPWK